MNAIIKTTNTIKGTIEIGGSKNASLPIIAASVLASGRVVLKNVPNIKDIDDLLTILRSINVMVTRLDKTLIIERKKKIKTDLLIEEVKRIRGSVYLLPVLLLLKKKVKANYPGGCNLGNRPIDYHLAAFEKMNVKNNSTNQLICLKTKKIKNGVIEFPQKTLGGTINIMILALFAKGETIIKNPSLEPEVLDTISFLNALGGNIKVLNNQLIIKGVKKLNGTTFKIMSDRIEAASYLFLAASMHSSTLMITNVDYRLLKTELKILEALGVEIKKDAYKIIVIKNSYYQIPSLNLEAGNYPLLSTDLQQVITPLLFNLKQASLITDYIYKDRILHLKELQKLNGQVAIISNQEKLVVEVNPSKLEATTINGVDLRGTFGLIIAAGMAKGTTKIIGIDNVLRGYEKIIEKLQKINFKIEVEK